MNNQCSYASVPHADQYFGTWAMEDTRLNARYEMLRALDVQAHIAAYKAPEIPIGTYEVAEGGIAVIEIMGMMSKYGSSLGDMPHGTLGVRRAIRNAVADQAIKGIVLRVESGGGAVTGTDDLADEVYRARDIKPVVAFVEDIGASAAYWVASQASRVIANRSAEVGSIGVYQVVRDYSAAAAIDGVKIHMIRSGKYKGIGTPGAEITPEQIQYLQSGVDEVHGAFVDAIAAGRKMDREAIAEIADGRVYVAKKAKEIGLIDAIGSFNSAVNEAAQLAAPNRRSRNMADEQKDTKAADAPATFAELKQAFEGAGTDFLCAQLEENATLAQAQKAWSKALVKQTADAKAEAEELKDAKAKADAELEELRAAPKKPGVPPVASGNQPNEDGEDPIRAYEAALAKETERCGGDKTRAAMALNRSQPELREAFVLAWNQKHGRG